MSLAEEPAPVIYVSHRQVSRTGMTFVVRSAAGPASLIGAIQRAIWELRPDQPIEDIATMDTVVGASVAQPRFAMALLSLFAGLALILAAVGVYGVISYSVGRRRREIGIRIALGARPAQVLRGVVRGSLALAGLGVALGLSGAALTMRLMAGLLYGVPALDPATFGLVGGLLLGISLLASVAPAVRASRVDPSLTMRSE
jgi:ABC-type antimicrobial peptide transport system permease subunit